MRLQSIQNADIIILSKSILESIRHLAEDTTRDSDKAYQAILNQIFEGKLRCGQPIRDSRLQEELGFGKTPLREALFRLVQDGYVTNVPHCGMFVASFDLVQLESMLNLRTVLGPVDKSKNSAGNPQCFQQNSKFGDSERWHLPSS